MIIFKSNTILPNGTLVSANNGLTATAGNVQLGGSLVQNTNIDLDSFSLTASKNGFDYFQLDEFSWVLDCGFSSGDCKLFTNYGSPFSNSELIFMSKGIVNFRVNDTSAVSAGISTGPSFGPGTESYWLLGGKVAAAVALDTANYIQVTINNVPYKIALVI